MKEKKNKKAIETKNKIQNSKLEKKFPQSKMYIYIEVYIYYFLKDVIMLNKC